MNPLPTALVIFAFVFGAAWLGLRIRAVYPKRHLGSETLTTAKFAIGLVSMMSALMLGLLVSSAKTKFDAERNEITAFAEKTVVLDRALAVYGPETSEARAQLREFTKRMIERTWPSTRGVRSQLDPNTTSAIDTFEAIVALSPKNESQVLVKRSLFSMAVDLGQMRWLLYTKTQETLPLPMVFLLVSWLAVIFFSYGLFANPNGTVVSILFVAALSVSGAMMMIMELNQAFGGIIGIDSTPMDMALTNLGR